MAPIMIRAEVGSMEKVIGTRTATAMVAVSPGSEPMTVPAMTPPRASMMFSGVRAAKRYSMPGIIQCSILSLLNIRYASFSAWTTVQSVPLFH